MNLPLPTARYASPAIFLHWLMALLIFIGFPLGVYMHELPLSPQKLQLYSYHKWIGISVLLLFFARLLARLSHQPPAALPAPAWQQRLAAVTHGLLYLLLLLVPMSGWLMSSAKGVPVVYLGVLPLPDLVGKNKELGDLLKEVHEVLNFSLLILVTFHVAATIKHQLIDKDGTLRRMLPVARQKKSSP